MSRVSRFSGVEIVTTSDPYRELIERLRYRTRESQTRAARALNTELVMLYWSIGRDILAQQQDIGWGDDVIGQIAADLRLNTGSARGFSRRNLFYMRRFAALWPVLEKVQSLSAQIGWSHHQVLLDKFAGQPDLYEWYCAKSAANRWSVRMLQTQIQFNLHKRQGVAITNFSAVVEPADAQQLLQATKDPYIFDFLELDEQARERQLEKALIDDIQKLLLELGTGFAFYGRQKPLTIGGQEFFPDLLFYHHTLRRFVVIELKVGKFQIESVSKMNFYLNAIDEQLCVGDDRESVGIILCTKHDETVAKLALHRVYAPIAISTWQDGKAESPAKNSPSFMDMTEEVPEELAELDRIRIKLIDRVAQRTPEILNTQQDSGSAVS